MTEIFTPEQERVIELYLKANNYDSVEDWAADSDYFYVDAAEGKGWYNDDWHMVDPKVQLWWAIEAMNDGKEICLAGWHPEGLWGCECRECLALQRDANMMFDDDNDGGGWSS